MRCLPWGVLIAADPSLLTVSTVRVDDPGPLLDLLPEDGALAWVQGEEGLVGWGESARFEAIGPGRFAEAQAWWDALVARAAVHDEVELPGTGLVAFGSFAFDPAEGSSALVVPQVVVGRRGDTWWRTTIGLPVDELPRTPLRPPSSVVFSDAEVTGAQWMVSVEQGVARIQAGDLEKVVLARALDARADEPVDLRWPLRRLAADYPGCWAFAVDGMLGATPEMLVRLEGGIATSRVLAGTLRRTGDANQDSRRGAALGRSIKDVEEHGYGVRSVVDALALHCTEVEVPAAPFVLELRNVMHLATDVRGVVTDGASVLQLLASLHPSAAVCGSPTELALDVIRQIEGLDRGRYAGPVGWLDARGDGEWGIALRCAQVDPQDPRRLRLFAGCGIVAGSQPLHELAESNAKLVPMRDALQG